VGRIEDLADIYERDIKVPWTGMTSGAQRVLMVIYDKELDRTLRTRIEEFAIRTQRAGKRWQLVDCTRWFAEWMAAEEYREAYFEHPEDLSLKLEGEFKTKVIERLRAALGSADVNAVVALFGVASLYGFVRVSELIRGAESDIKGRLVIFFPGTKDGNNYRLLDARDGWNYLAHSISLHTEGATT